jgi:predicted TIM-barrel fold metal-dependent hydrolase
MPFLAGRIDGASATAKDRMPAGFLAEAKKFHYDTAGAVNRGALVSLIDLVSPSHVLFGTDFPPGGTNRAVAGALAELKLFADKDLQAIERDNAVRLLPRLNR